MISEQLLEAVRTAMSQLGVDPLPDGVVIERPARREHGDWSTNAALVSAKAAGRNPRQLGEELLAQLSEAGLDHVESLDLAGPGFVNFHLKASWLHDLVREVVAQGEESFGRLEIGAGRSVNIEFVSANPTGPIHAGGGRWGAYGDSLARIFDRCGYKTHKEFYINDRGVQAKLFGQSLLAARQGKEPPPDGYVGQYITDWAAEMPADADPVTWGLDRSLREAREVLASMHVEFDTWSSEAVQTAAEANGFEPFFEAYFLDLDAGESSEMDSAPVIEEMSIKVVGWAPDGAGTVSRPTTRQASRQAIRVAFGEMMKRCAGPSANLNA